MKIITRSQWKARKPSGELYEAPRSKREFFVVHHSGEDDDQTVKSIERYHMESDQLAKGGWKAIGYNYLITKNGDIYEGVGIDKIGAHVRGYNTKAIGVCIIGDYRKRMPTLKAIQALEWLYGECNDKVGKKLKLRGHGQLANSECPGDRLLNELMDGVINVRNPQPQKPQEPNKESWFEKLMEDLPELNKGDKGIAVKRAQALINVGGGNLKEDGLFGDNTERETKEYQEKHGLKPDGIIGPKTWTKLLVGS
jgi:N-acetylmuramoyl-L-alanine amidase